MYEINNQNFLNKGKELEEYFCIHRKSLQGSNLKFPYNFCTPQNSQLIS